MSTMEVSKISSAWEEYSMIFTGAGRDGGGRIVLEVILINSTNFRDT